MKKSTLRIILFFGSIFLSACNSPSSNKDSYLKETPTATFLPLYTPTVLIPTITPTPYGEDIRAQIVEAYDKLKEISYKKEIVTEQSDGENETCIYYRIPPDKARMVCPNFEIIIINPQGYYKLDTTHWISIESPDSFFEQEENDFSLIQNPQIKGEDTYNGFPVLIYNYTIEGEETVGEKKIEYIYNVDFWVGKDDGLPYKRITISQPVSGTGNIYHTISTFSYDDNFSISPPQANYIYSN